MLCRWDQHSSNRSSNVGSCVIALTWPCLRWTLIFFPANLSHSWTGPFGRHLILPRECQWSTCKHQIRITGDCLLTEQISQHKHHCLSALFWACLTFTCVNLHRWSLLMLAAIKADHTFARPWFTVASELQKDCFTQQQIWKSSRNTNIMETGNTICKTRYYAVTAAFVSKETLSEIWQESLMLLMED